MADVTDKRDDVRTSTDELKHIADVLAFDIADTLLGLANTLAATPHDELGNNIGQHAWALRGIGLRLDSYSLKIYEYIEGLENE